MTNRFECMKRLSVVVGLVILTCGCDGRTPSSPTSPSSSSASEPTPTLNPAPTRPAPIGARPVKGMVQDTAFRPLAGALLEVLDGPRAGQSATTDAEGLFSMPGSFDDNTKFRATKDGHVTATAIVRPGCDSCPYAWMWFRLEVLAPPVNIAGDYTLTFVADSTCTDLPSEVRTRTYEVTIAPLPDFHGPDTFFTLALNGARILDLGFPPIGVAGNFVAFAFFEDGLPYLVEEVAPDARLEITGYAEASVGTSGVSTISTNFEGWIEYVGPSTRPRVRCGLKSHHQLILTRR